MQARTGTCRKCHSGHLNRYRLVRWSPGVCSSALATLGYGPVAHGDCATITELEKLCVAV